MGLALIYRVRQLVEAPELQFGLPADLDRHREAAQRMFEASQQSSRVCLQCRRSLVQLQAAQLLSKMTVTSYGAQKVKLLQ